MVGDGSAWNGDVNLQAYLMEFAPCASLTLRFCKSLARMCPEDGSAMPKPAASAELPRRRLVYLGKRVHCWALDTDISTVALALFAMSSHRNQPFASHHHVSST